MFADRKRMLWRAVAAVLLALALVWARPSAAQEPPPEALEAVQRAIARGSASGVLAGAAEQVEVAVLGRSTVYSRSQALYVLSEFFKQHPPASVAFGRASEAEGSVFVPGAYTAAGAEAPFQVYLRLRQKGARLELKEIRFERRLR